METFRATATWRRHLAEGASAPQHTEALDRLRVGYLRMRERVAQLVLGIHDDCKGLTVHDLTHLDALWDVADTILGDSYPLTPAEVFVLGGAILIHDAGMTVAAFPNGLSQIKATVEWKDTLNSIVRRLALSGAKISADDPPAEVVDEALFFTLRDLHARVAEQLATQSWELPGGSQMHLLEDEGLRRAYGLAIGRIAHSHHWDRERLLIEFNLRVGAAPGLPPEWVVNEVKLACVLRCIDIAHIDERRAPSFIYALSKPTGVSAEHWSFQNKMNQPTADDGQLIYTSGKAFELAEASAWWRAYDAVGAIDDELRGCHQLLPEAKAEPFAVSGVAGARNPRLLGRYIKPAGWEPVRAEVTVSDPIALARTLGGQNLYGDSPLPVIREMLQNAADAVRARRRLESRSSDWGYIRASVTPAIVNGREGAWLHVDDDGVGMSQAVLTGPLIDFGKSLWSSPMLRDELPGLAGKGIDPVGKFGIGFFSVFLLGDVVLVASKRFNQGDELISVMHFGGLSARPILRKGSRADLPQDMSTRVSVFIAELDRLKFPHGFGYHRDRERSLNWLVPSLRRLIASLDVRILFNNEVDGTAFEHTPDWDTSDPKVFLGELYGDKWLEAEDGMRECYTSSLRTLRDQSGRIWGRAAFGLQLDDDRYDRGGDISVGGFTAHANDGSFPYVGVLAGDAWQVSREKAVRVVPKDVMDVWLTEQARILATLDMHENVRVRAGQRLFQSGIRMDGLPVCFFSNRTKTWADLKARLKILSRVILPMSREYNDTYATKTINGLSIAHATMEMSPDVMFLFTHPLDPLRVDAARRRELKDGDSLNPEEISKEMSGTLSMMEEAWESQFSIALKYDNVFVKTVPGVGARSWALELSKK